MGEQVVEVAVRPAGSRDDRDLAVQRAAASQAVELQEIGGVNRTDQCLVACLVAFGQPVSQEEGTARGAGAHQHAGDGQCHGVVSSPIALSTRAPRLGQGCSKDARVEAIIAVQNPSVNCIFTID